MFILYLLFFLFFRKFGIDSPRKIFASESPNKNPNISGSDIKVLNIGDGSDIAVADFEKIVDKKRMIAVKLVTQPYKNEVNTPNIGAHVIKNKNQIRSSPYHHKDTSLTQIIFYWGHKDVFIMDLTKNGKLYSHS